MLDTDSSLQSCGVVVIGRNEGARLVRCFASVGALVRKLVYVDSGSTDDSVAHANSVGAQVVRMDISQPFTAARSRNAGYEHLRKLDPNLAFVQFVDGDCEVVDGWLRKAAHFLEDQPGIAVVAGRVRERYPAASVYNLLCDMEWDTPVGETKACGGIALMRMAAFDQVSGFRPDLIAGEEPELCVRLRRAGWKIWRLDAEMVLHDAAMTRFAQWWRRTMRGGYAFAEGAALHGAPPERHWVAESRRAWFWGGVLPIGALLVSAWSGFAAVALSLLYPAQVARLGLKGNRTMRENWIRAFFLVLGKFPEMLGQVRFWLTRARVARRTLIEYK